MLLLLTGGRLYHIFLKQHIPQIDPKDISKNRGRQALREEINASLLLCLNAFVGAAAACDVHVPCKHLLCAAVGARELVENGKVMREVLDDNGVMHSVVAGCAEAQRFQHGVPRVTHFAVDEQEPAAVCGAEGGPGARVDPEADARREVEWNKDEESGVVAEKRVRSKK